MRGFNMSRSLALFVMIELIYRQPHESTNAAHLGTWHSGVEWKRDLQTRKETHKRDIQRDIQRARKPALTYRQPHESTKATHLCTWHPIALGTATNGHSAPPVVTNGGHSDTRYKQRHWHSDTQDTNKDTANKDTDTRTQTQTKTQTLRHNGDAECRVLLGHKWRCRVLWCSHGVVCRWGQVYRHDMAVPSAISPQLCPTTRFCVRGCFFFPVYACHMWTNHVVSESFIQKKPRLLYMCFSPCMYPCMYVMRVQITSFWSHFYREIFSEWKSCMAFFDFFLIDSMCAHITIFSYPQRV